MRKVEGDRIAIAFEPVFGPILTRTLSESNRTDLHET